MSTPPTPSPRASDPFPLTADPGAYVPRTATESVLVALEMALDAGARVLELVGPSGAGKTLLLHVLAQRVDGRFQPLHLPYPKLSPREFCQWALCALNQAECGHPEQTLRARIARDADRGFPPLLWMVDDASSMPAETLGCLMELQADYPSGMRTLLAVSEEAYAEERPGRLPSHERIPLEGYMDRQETTRYVHARLEHSGAGPGDRADWERWLEHLYRESGGNPARLHRAAAALLLRSTAARSAGRSA